MPCLERKNMVLSLQSQRVMDRHTHTVTHMPEPKWCGQGPGTILNSWHSPPQLVYGHSHSHVGHAVSCSPVRICRGTHTRMFYRERTLEEPSFSFFLGGGMYHTSKIHSYVLSFSFWYTSTQCSTTSAVLLHYTTLPVLLQCRVQ